MFEASLEQFVIKRVIVLWILLSITDFLLVDQKWIIFAGLTLGMLLGLLRLWIMGSVFSKLLVESEVKTTVIGSIFKNLITLFIIFVILLISAKINIWLFTGLTAGFLTIPCVVFLSSIVEYIKKR